VSTTVDTVIRQLTFSGERLLICAELLDPREFYAENADGYSAAWTIGHLACVTDLFRSWFDGEMLFEPGFHQVFNETAVVEEGVISKAATVDPARFPKELLMLRFREAQIKAMYTMEEFGFENWDEPGPPGLPVTIQTGGRLWEILAVHTEWHLGALAASVPRFRGTYLPNVLPHHLYRKEETVADQEGP
jgi:hypothetical protein